MYAIETHLGRFEADTEKQAKALLRKAEKAHKAQQDIDNRNYQLAYVRAQAQAYTIMERLAKGEDMPRGWRLKTITADSYCVQAVTRDFHTEWIVDVGNIRAQSHFHGAQPYEYIENGAGYCLALVFHNPKTGEQIFQAVGIEADQLAVVEIYGITAQHFEREQIAA
jgi:hypothetical protein